MSLRFKPVLKMRNIRSLVPLIDLGEQLTPEALPPTHAVKIRLKPIGPFGKRRQTKPHRQTMQHELWSLVENCPSRLLIGSQSCPESVC